jgi:hypothetical protein
MEEHTPTNDEKTKIQTIINDASKTLRKHQNRIESVIMILGSFYAMGVMVLSGILYYYFQDSFTIFSLWFSNMGVGPTGWSFNRGLQGTAILYSFMVLFFIFRFYNTKKSSRILIAIASIFGIVAIVGIFILTENNMIENPSVHNVGAFMYFIATPVYCTMLSVALALEGASSKLQWIVTVGLVITSIAMAPIMSLIAVHIGIDPSDVLGSMDPRFAVARLFEWGAVFLFFLWIFQTGLLLRKQSKKKDENN